LDAAALRADKDQDRIPSCCRQPGSPILR